MHACERNGFAAPIVLLPPARRRLPPRDRARLDPTRILFAAFDDASAWGCAVGRAVDIMHRIIGWRELASKWALPKWDSLWRDDLLGSV